MIFTRSVIENLQIRFFAHTYPESLFASLHFRIFRGLGAFSKRFDRRLLYIGYAVRLLTRWGSVGIELILPPYGRVNNENEACAIETRVEIEFWCEMGKIDGRDRSLIRWR